MAKSRVNFFFQISHFIVMFSRKQEWYRIYKENYTLWTWLIMWITFQFENTRRNESTERYSGGSTKLKSITKQLARKGGTDQAWYRARVVQQTTEDSTSAWKTATLHARTNFGILSCFLSGPIFLSLIIWFYNPVLGHCLFSEKQLTIYFSWLPLRVSYLKLILSSC